MAQTTPQDLRGGVARIDHGAIPVNDAGRALQFYRDLLGAQLTAIGHLTNKPFRDGQGPMIFLEIAGHRGWALALEFDDLPPPIGDFECPCWAFKVTEDVLQNAVGLLKQRNIPYKVVEGRASSPIKRSVFLHDTEGNSIELCVHR
jgi:catechol 2,3-dioxygenase-like lactoylglutathione lyase family enzyme